MDDNKIKNKDNSGYCNSGDYNSGYCNSGDYNSGYCNSGDYNSGYCNSGDYNSGYFNSGDYNSGDYNSGDYNSGYCNSGDCNSGDYNSGYCNSGDYNSGDYNSGDFNSTSFSAGCFNTKPQKLYFFDKQSEWYMGDWKASKAYEIMKRVTSLMFEWVGRSEMTEDEIESFPSSKTTGGYLKAVGNSEAYKEWWSKLHKTEKDIIRGLPNFDTTKFAQITGIDVEFLDNE